MTISANDIKILWGMAARKCSKPGCGEECIKFIDDTGPTVIGEMAHIIAHSPEGPRGVSEGGEDSYGNLILLCPTHHTETDKSPTGSFSEATLREWKRLHEDAIKASFASPKFASIRQFAFAVKRLLFQNKAAWQTYGPESEAAKSNPLSNLYEVWNLRKLDTIVPNNRRIINLIRANEDIIPLEDLPAFVLFIEHAEGFERNCYNRTEGIPRFPSQFEGAIDSYVTA